MQLQEIDIYVRPDGTVKLEVRGVPGQQCLKLTEGLEKLLGGQVLAREHTCEFDQPAQQTVTDTAKLQSGW
jgi:hypothetical protein